jgi:hypothetical protein
MRPIWPWASLARLWALAISWDMLRRYLENSAESAKSTAPSLRGRGSLRVAVSTRGIMSRARQEAVGGILQVPLRLVRRTELAPSRLPRRSTNLSGFAAAGIRARSRRNSSGGGNWLVPRRAETCRGRYEWPKRRGELGSPGASLARLDKLKHVPRPQRAELDLLNAPPRARLWIR